MPLPLAGLTVLDLTHVLAGPFAALTLADLGAKVIKVERPGGGDATRAFPPFKNGKSAYFAALNHSKASIALDLGAEADRAVFDRLVSRADVLLESFRPGVMERLGYGWDSLHRSHPALIYGAVSGYGHTGPDARRPSYDIVAQARAGALSLSGAPDGPPRRGAAATGDIAAGMYLAQGVLAALLDRATTGRGRKIDVAMLDAQFAILDHALASASTGARPAGASGTRHPAVAPVETVEASDGPFALAAGNDALFDKLCEALPLPIANDPRFASNPARVENARLLTRLIEAVTLENTRAHWIARLTAAGVPVAPILTVEEVMRDPQIAARNMVVDVLDRNGRQAFKAAGNPIKLSDAEDRTARAQAPDLDGNRGEILRWLDDG